MNGAPYDEARLACSNFVHNLRLGTNTDQAGNKALTGVFFGGKKYELSIGEASAATTTSSDKTPASN